MTLAQFLDVVKNRHNASGDTFWGEQEIYQLITNRCNEVLAIIGLLEETTTAASVASTQAYNYPSDAVVIRQIDYKSDRLKRISFRQWEHFKTESGTIEGTPTMWVPWKRQYNLVPTPDTDNDTITVYYYKEHPYIDNSTQTTIDIPSVLHNFLTFGVLADMYTKDLNAQLAQYYEDKWLNVAMPAFYKFKAQEDTASGYTVVGDADTDELVDMGTK